MAATEGADEITGRPGPGVPDDGQAVVRGVSPVLVTAFHDDGEVDTRSFRRAVEAVLATGVTSVMFPGFASEFHMLDDEERWALLDELLRATAGSGVAVVGSVAGGGTRVACRTARTMVERGVHVVNVLPPWVQSPPAPAVLEHLAAVAGSVGSTPVILQYAPEMTTTRLSVDDVRTLVAAQPNVAAVKVEMRAPSPFVRALLGADPPIQSLLGIAGLELPAALDAGVVGVQPGGGFVELYVTMLEAWDAGDVARVQDVYRRLLPYLTHWMSSGSLLQAAKLIAFRRGHLDSPTCRRPVAALTPYADALTVRFLEEFADELAAPRGGGAP